MTGGAWRVGVDTGGTFTDVVSYRPSSGEVRTTKLSSDRPPDEMLGQLCRLGVDAPATVVHGTTRITNAILEGRIARTALVTTRGFADILSIGRQARDDLYDLARPARATPVVPPDLCFELDERCRPDGSVLVALDDGSLRDLVERISRAEVEAVAVCLLHSYANPEHERRVGAALGEHWPVALSHRVSAERREYERASTTALNAGVMGYADEYLGELDAAVERHAPGSRLYVVQSSGGMIATDAARELPLATVMSGPAAGVVAAARLGGTRAVSLDMGGTSTDVSLIRDGRITSVRDRHIGGHAVRLPTVAVESIAVGGGSIAWVDDVGALRVGPRSAGATPGPACFARGGTEPTVTDADVVVGLIEDREPFGDIHLEPALAREALQPLARRLGFDVAAAARAVLDVAYAQIERALRAVTVQRGYDLRTCTLIAYGGAGAVHSGPLAARAAMPRVVVPRLASVFSALGCCLSEVAVEVAQTDVAPLESGALREVGARMQTMVDAELDRLRGEVRHGGTVVVERRAELRYRGQNDAIPVPWDDSAGVAALRRAFNSAHDREYGFTTDDPVEVVALRCRISVTEPVGWPDTDSATTGGPGIGTAVEGPATVPLPMTSATLVEGQRAVVDDRGNLVVQAA